MKYNAINIFMIDEIAEKVANKVDTKIYRILSGEFKLRKGSEVDCQCKNLEEEDSRTVSGKDADRFVENMIKKETEPLNEEDIKRIKMVAETLGIPENELKI